MRARSQKDRGASSLTTGTALWEGGEAASSGGTKSSREEKRPEDALAI